MIMTSLDLCSPKDELEIDFLKEGWTEDSLENGLVYTVARSLIEKTNKDWIIHLVRSMIQCGGRMTSMSYFQVWSFTIKDG
jgi:hypothetical protein